MFFNYIDDKTLTLRLILLAVTSHRHRLISQIELSTVTGHSQCDVFPLNVLELQKMSRKKHGSVIPVLLAFSRECKLCCNGIKLHVCEYSLAHFDRQTARTIGFFRF